MQFAARGAPPRILVVEALRNSIQTNLGLWWPSFYLFSPPPLTLRESTVSRKYMDLKHLLARRWKPLGTTQLAVYGKDLTSSITQRRG